MSVVINAPAVYAGRFPTARRDRSAARRRSARRPGDGLRPVLALALAFPIAVAVLVLPRVAGIGGAATANPTTRPLSGAASINRPSPAAAVAPLPALEPATRTTSAPAASSVMTVQEPIDSETSTGTYVVQPGDELRHIAAARGVNIPSLLAINDVPDPDSLRVGQVLKLPSSR